MEFAQPIHQPTHEWPDPKEAIALELITTKPRRPSRFSITSLPVTFPTPPRRTLSSGLAESLYPTTAKAHSEENLLTKRKSRFEVTQFPVVHTPTIQIIPPTPHVELPSPPITASTASPTSPTSSTGFPTSPSSTSPSPTSPPTTIPPQLPLSSSNSHSPTTIACIRPHILAEKLYDQLPQTPKPHPHTIAKSKPLINTNHTSESMIESPRSMITIPAVVVSKRGRFTVTKEHSTQWRPRQTLSRGGSRFIVVREGEAETEEKPTTRRKSEGADAGG